MNAARKAVYLTQNSSIEAAVEWIMNHMDDPDFNDAHPDLKGTRKTQSQEERSATADPGIQELVCLGFAEHKAKHALQQSGGDINGAAEWLFMNGDTLPDQPPEVSEPVEVATPKVKNFRNGSGKYQLRGIISHMGTSPHSGKFGVCLFVNFKN